MVGFESVLHELWQQKQQELEVRISELTAELAKATENKQQLELDYSNKWDAFESLSAEFLAEKVSFEVSRRLRITSAVYTVCLSLDVIECCTTAVFMFTNEYAFIVL